MASKSSSILVRSLRGTLILGLFVWAGQTSVGCVSKEEFLDADGDGRTGADDCDEGNPLTYKGALEQPHNGVDDNCDGQTDEPTDNNDWDEDGFTVLNGDCNDQNAAINPSAKEVCDGIDNNCNLPNPLIDEADPTLDVGGGCPSGFPGACSIGKQRCVDGALKCEPTFLPTDQAKNKDEDLCNGIDDDCDGSLDEGCNCIDGQTQPCGLTFGECGKSPGTQICVKGDWSECQNPPQPGVETCNGLDDDCNGSIDDAARVCFEGTGCAITVPACENESDIDCNVKYAAEKEKKKNFTELCDGIDNNCNGQTDEGCDCTDGQIMPCGTVGTDTTGCEPGTVTQGNRLCSGGKWGECQGATCEKCVKLETLSVPVISTTGGNDFNGPVTTHIDGEIKQSPSQVAVQVCVHMKGPDEAGSACKSSVTVIKNEGLVPSVQKTFSYPNIPQSNTNGWNGFFYVVPTSLNPKTELIDSIYCQGDTTVKDFCSDSPPVCAGCVVRFGCVRSVVVLQ